MKATRLIGCKCKCGDTFSLAILIGRGLDQVILVHKSILVQFNVCTSKEVLENGNVLKKSVLLAMRIHLFPFRTQKLSSSVSKILGG